MESGKVTCNSCKRRLTNLNDSTRFLCPKCGKHEIIRCGHCREIIAKYRCPGCGFEGPN